jgi:hypothetical protein
MIAIEYNMLAAKFAIIPIIAMFSRKSLFSVNPYTQNNSESTLNT